MPGSAQVRLSYLGEIWVISGDYKTVADGLSPAFESVKCHHFVTESTFGLPIFHWRPQMEVFHDMNTWWQRNAENGFTSIMLGYSLGKAQRIMKYLDRNIGDVICHSAIADANRALESSGFTFGSWTEAGKGKITIVIGQNGGGKFQFGFLVAVAIDLSAQRVIWPIHAANWQAFSGQLQWLDGGT